MSICLEKGVEYFDRVEGLQKWSGTEWIWIDHGRNQWHLHECPIRDNGPFVFVEQKDVYASSVCSLRAFECYDENVSVAKSHPV